MSVQFEIPANAAPYTGPVWVDHLLVKGVERSVRNATFTPVATTEMTYDWAARQTAESSYDGESISQSFTYTYDGYGEEVISGEPNVFYDFETGTTTTVDATNADAESEVPPTEDDSGSVETQALSDNRQRVTDTTVNPYKKIVLIGFTDGGSCTGWLSDPNTVITAGHCIYTATSPRVERTVALVSPARNDFVANPYPYGKCYQRRRSSVHDWWRVGKSWSYDVGAIFLTCNVGNTTAWFQYPEVKRNLKDEGSQYSGYPVDKYAQNGRRWAQYRSSGKVRVYRVDYSNVINTSNYNYPCSGQSGGPVYQYDPTRCPNSRYCVIVITSRHTGDNGTLAVIMDHSVRNLIGPYASWW